MPGFLFEGGGYRHQEMLELVEDLGGSILQVRLVGSEVTITFSVPEEDVGRVEELTRDLQGKLKRLPLLGSEIAVVSPTITRHHLPHPLCDVAEYLRREGAKTNMIGLARGPGQRICQISEEEKRLIEEHDAAVFVLGNFEHCLREHKWRLFKDLSVPVVVAGGPELPSLPHAFAYVSGIGRVPYRARTFTEIGKLDEVARAVERALEEERRRLSLDPPLLSPLVLKAEIERKLGETLRGGAPLPVTPQLRGVRVKLPYPEFAGRLAELEVAGHRLGEIAEIRRSAMRDYILVILLPLSRLELPPERLRAISGGVKV
ncbi:MAG: methanogenesis marker 7 protein [Hadesarchaea archaeon]|nr:methanogenesis marker 7 protein [Hadesarchaea archaeon]